MKVNLESIVPEIRKFIARYGLEAQDEEDILQDTLLKIYLKSESVKEPEKFRNWCLKIARNTVFTHFQKRKKVKETMLFEFLAAENDNKNYNEVLFRCVEKIAAGLDQSYTEALDWVYVQGNSQVSLARTKGVSVSTIKSRVQRGRKLIREKLRDCCHLEFDGYGNLVDYKPKKHCI